MAETLRMFDPIKETEMADLSSGSESDEQKSPVAMDKSIISTDDEALMEEKIQKHTQSDDEEPNSSPKNKRY
jgi:hypothetical protein